VLPVFVSLFFHIEQRYLLPLLLFTILFLVSSSADLLKRKITPISQAFSLAGLVVLFAMTYYSYYPLAVEMPNLIREKEEAVSFVSSLPKTSLILSKKPVYAFFARTDYYPLPWVETKDEFERYLNNHQGGLVILDDWSRNTIPTTETIIKENFAGKVGVVEYAK
jgi:hypothetical protein